MDQEKIGNLIKDIRTNNNLTQKEFADSLGVTYQAVSKWENGKNLPDLLILKEISEKYNIDINDLLDTKKEVKETKENKKINKKVLVIVPIILVTVITLITLLIVHLSNDNFEFKKIDTTCDEFTVSGSVAYNASKTYIYISDLKYCGKENNITYNKIISTLFLSKDNIDVRMYTDTKENMTLNEYLEKFSMSVNSNICLNLKGDLTLKINAYDEDNKITVYSVPLTLSDTCALE